MGLGGGRGIGLGGLLILGVLSLLFKTNLLPLGGIFSGGFAGSSLAPGRPPTKGGRGADRKFVSFVLDDAQDTWTKIFAEQGAQYPHAKLVLFRTYIRSACGMAESASGPFYCPATRRSTLTCRSSTSCAATSERRASSPRRTCWRTNSGITFRM